MRTLLIAVLCVVISAALVLAERPLTQPNNVITSVSRVMSYQGMLRDGAGDPVPDATYNIVFRIYDDATAGNLLWTSAAIPATTKYGYFSAEFEPSGLNYDITYYISIQVGADPEMASRQRMTAVPYSIMADTTDVTSIWYQSGNVLYTAGNLGVAKGNSGNILFGVGDSTHVNFGVACTTGVSGQHNYFCTVAGGYRNTAGGRVSFVGGGQRNNASDTGCFIGGGRSNFAGSNSSVVAGGQNDTASGRYSTIGGGFANMASATTATIAGGSGNIASGISATTSGGYHNTASGGSASIGGGYTNSASGNSSTVGGGTSDTASGQYATVAGGLGNVASGDDAAIGGGQGNTASGSHVAVGGGSANTASGPFATVSGGGSNTASADGASVGGGSINIASGFASVVGGGIGDTASNSYATVGGGLFNAAGGMYSTVSGGQGNKANIISATVSGGEGNTASGYASSVSGGGFNLASGGHSCIPGGNFDTIGTNGILSMVFGYQVYCDDDSRVTFFNGTSYGSLNVNRDGHDGYNIFPIQVGTTADNGNGAYLSNGGVWTNGSSRTFKENFTPIPGNELLSRIAGLSIASYNYKNSTEKHFGPVAEEFVGAFDTGVMRESDNKRDDMYLSSGDVAGVALAGVQELLKKINDLEAKNTELEKRISDLEHK